MIWGDIINAVRSLHLNLIESLELRSEWFTQEMRLLPVELSFLPSTGQFTTWHALEVPAFLEFNPIERLLVEGPLLPTEKVTVPSESALAQLSQQLLILETEWLIQLSNEHREMTLEPALKTLEQLWRSEWLRIQTKAGFNRLKVVSS
jgi:hypothetical protein